MKSLLDTVEPDCYMASLYQTVIEGESKIPSGATAVSFRNIGWKNQIELYSRQKVEALLEECRKQTIEQCGTDATDNKVQMHVVLNKAYAVLLGLAYKLDLKAFNADLCNGRSFFIANG